MQFPSSSVKAALNKKKPPFLTLGVVIALTVILGTFASVRFYHAGQWEPSVPDHIGAWVAQPAPLAPGTLEMLGNPHGYGKMYTNPFAEHATLSVISAGPFENYHDPTVCGTGNGFRLTSLKTFPMDSEKDGRVRAMIFKRGENERIMFYYWAQTRNGRTETEARMGTYRDLWARLQTGFNAVVRGDQVCLIRILALVPPGDKNGAQTQRNIHEIARGVYRDLLAQEKSKA